MKTLLEAFQFLEATAKEFAGADFEVCEAEFLANPKDLDAAMLHEVIAELNKNILTAMQETIGDKKNEDFTKQNSFVNCMKKCGAHMAALVAIAPTSTSAPTSTTSVSSSQLKEQKRQVLHDAANHANAIAATLPTMQFGKLYDNHSHSNGTTWTALRLLVDSNDFNLCLKDAEKVKVLRQLSIAVTVVMNKTTGNNVSQDKIHAFLANGNDYNVNLLFLLNDQTKRVGSRSGGLRVETKTTLHEDATTTTTSGLWQTLSSAQAMNSVKVTYNGSQFVGALRTWSTLWFYLRFEMWLPLQCFLTQLSSFVLASFGFELHQCSPHYHQDFLMSLFNLIDTMVAYSKHYADDDFRPGLCNPMQTVVNGQLPNSTEVIASDCGILDATRALLTVVRENRLNYSRNNFRDIEDDNGKHLVVSNKGRLLVFKNKYVVPEIDGSKLGSLKTFVCESYDKSKTSVRGYLDSKTGTLHAH